MYYEGKGLVKDFNKATYWICRASETANFKANKFRIKMRLSLISDEYQPLKCSSALDILKIKYHRGLMNKNRHQNRQNLLSH